MPKDTWITAQRAAAVIGCSVRQVGNLGREGELTRKISEPQGYGRPPFAYSAESVRDYVAARKIPRGFATIRDAAKILGVAESTLRGWCKSGQVKAARSTWRLQGGWPWLVWVGDV